MVITMGNIATYIGIMVFTASVIKCLIITPLQLSIKELKVSIEKLDNKLSVMNEKYDTYKERLVQVEASSKQAHKRIDRLENFFDEKGAD